jgi:hypothetical protein
LKPRRLSSGISFSSRHVLPTPDVPTTETTGGLFFLLRILINHFPSKRQKAMKAGGFLASDDQRSSAVFAITWQGARS